ncbi:MAG: hypothetical protein RIC16_17460 [Rhodospirillales bacterium]
MITSPSGQPSWPASNRDNAILALVLLVAIAGKVWTVAAYGGFVLGDNMGFVVAADQILAGTDWLHDAGLDDDVTPPTLWRPIGYSMIIAGTKAMAGDAWPYLLCGIQATLSLLAGIMLLRLCREAGLGVIASALVFLLHQWSAPMSTDALIMEDALTGAFGMMALILVLLPVCRGEIPSSGRFLVAGLAAALSLTIRDVYHFLMPVIGLGAMVLVARADGLRRAAVAFVALVLPVLAADAGLRQWNEYRTGSAVTTVAGQTAYLYGILRAAQFDETLLDGDDAVMQTVRRLNETYEYEDTRIINDALFKEQGMNGVEQMLYFGARYWSAMLTHPIAMARAALQRVRPVLQATLFAGPIARIDDLDWWKTGATGESFYGTGWRAEAQTFRDTLDPGELTPRVAFHLGIRALSRIAGGIVLAVFAIGVPYLWWRNRREPDPALNAAMLVWALYGLWVCLYIPVSFEVRYLAPVVGPAIMAAALVLCRAWCAFRNRRNPSAFIDS